MAIAANSAAHAQSNDIRVLLANHPYGDLLKASIPEFEASTGIKVNAESLQESQLTTKLTTEFATRSSSVDVFMTRPTQDGKLFQKNGWYEALVGYDFADYPGNAMSVVGEARDLIGEVILEAINTKGQSTKLQAMAKDRAEKVNELLQDTGEYGK